MKQQLEILTDSALASSLPSLLCAETLNLNKKNIICCYDNFRGSFVPFEIFTVGPELAAVDRTVGVNDSPGGNLLQLLSPAHTPPRALILIIVLVHLGLQSLFDWHGGSWRNLDKTGRKMCVRFPWQHLRRRPNTVPFLFINRHKSMI